eukprot:1088611-Rhodomonas_salina.1
MTLQTLAGAHRRSGTRQRVRNSRSPMCASAKGNDSVLVTRSRHWARPLDIGRIANPRQSRARPTASWRNT